MCMNHALSHTVNYNWNNTFPEGGKMALGISDKSFCNKAIEA